MARVLASTFGNALGYRTHGGRAAAICLGGCLWLFGVGCSFPLVTTYGRSPEELSPGNYRFRLSYNADAGDKDIDDKASSIVEDLRRRYGYEVCEFTRSPMVDPWRNKEVVVSVTCRRPPESGARAIR